MKNTPPGVPTLPTSAFNAFTASALNNPFVCASAAPAMIATAAGLCSANSFARRSIRAVEIPVRLLTSGGVYSVSPADQPSISIPAGPASAALRAPDLMMTCAMPSARTPSIPGLTATHSSAFAPVCDIRYSTWTNFPRLPGFP